MQHRTRNRCAVAAALAATITLTGGVAWSSDPPGEVKLHTLDFGDRPSTDTIESMQSIVGVGDVVGQMEKQPNGSCTSDEPVGITTESPAGMQGKVRLLIDETCTVRVLSFDQGPVTP